MVAAGPTALRFYNENRQFTVPGGGGNPRDVLTQATTYYVATNGDDTKDGTTIAKAWATYAHATSVLFNQLDFGGQNVTLQAVTGHANFTTTLNISGWVGGGSLTYDGGAGTFNTTSADNISTSGILGGNFKIQNVTFGTTTSGNGISHLALGKVLLGTGLIFGACPNSAHIRGGGFSLMQKQNGYTINGSAAFHIEYGTGFFDAETFPTTDTITGGPTFNVFFFVTGSGANVFVDGVTYPATGAYQTGSVSNNAILHAAGRTLPGNGTVLTPNGGQFS